MGKRRRNSPEREAWSSMRKRCFGKWHKAYANYGGRGIGVCEEWSSFDQFLADMGSRPPGTSLDRVDNNEGYSAKNCRWATKLEQENNKRNNKFITAYGKTQTLAQWSRELGFAPKSVNQRLRKGLSLEEALTIPKLGQLFAFGRLRSTAEWAQEYNIKVNTLTSRILFGMSAEKALTKPVVPPKGRKHERDPSCKRCSSGMRTRRRYHARFKCSLETVSAG